MATRSQQISRLALCVAFAIVATSISLHSSFEHGRLSIYPRFDDVGYMADGLQRLRTFQHGGLRAAFEEYVKRPPHSPYSDLLAAVSFAIFGVHDWAPYVCSGLLVLAFFVAADHFLGDDLSLWQRAAALVIFMCLPFVRLAASEIRPDYAACLLTSVGTLMLITQPFIRSGWKHKLVCGALFGLAMLIKPPFFPATALLLGVSLVLACVCDRYGRGLEFRLSEAAGSWLLALLPFLLIPLPHYLVGGKAIAAYIYDNQFGAHRAEWAKLGDLRYHLTYFLTGPGGWLMLGRVVCVNHPGADCRRPPIATGRA